VKAKEELTRFANLLVNSTEDEIEALAYNSPAVHFACYCSIRDKDNRVIRGPEPNIMQLRMSKAYETMRDLGAKVRIIVVKPRRAGCSSFASHIVYHHGMTHPIEGISISDVKEHSAEIMAKLRDYSKTDAYPWGHSIVQSASASLAWSNGTKWTIDTAENPDAGVGGTRQAGHFSEVSKWPQTQTRNDKKTMAAVLPSLSGQETVAIAESTPEGAAGWMYSTWQEAIILEDFVERWNAGFQPEEQWVKVFAAWFEFGDNARKQPVSDAERQEIEATLTDHERRERELYGLTYEQLAWRRDTIKAVCNGDPKVFAYYYPSDEVSCWLASGSPRFDMGRIVAWEDAARGVVPETGYLVKQDRGNVTWHPQQDGTGEILVWERPKPGLRYVVTVDPAESKSQTIGADPDRNSISVWRAGYHDTGLDRWMKAKKVARVRPPYYAEEDEVAHHAIRLSVWYGRALIAQETNKGFHCLRVLQEAGMPLYKRKPLSHRTGHIEEQYGFKTDANNREAIISGLASAIANDDLEIRCLHTLAEMKAFVRNIAKGRSEAAPGMHDDDVMADAIAWEVLPSATEFTRHEARHEDPPDEQGWKSASWKW
jgi:hypothetical protein